MDDELLIEQVRQYEELYDTSRKNYNDYAYRDVIWRKIAKELNTTATACKTRWVSLRDQLRKVLRRNAEKRPPGTRKIKKWKYEDCMSYLIPYFKVRESHSHKTLLDDSNQEFDEDSQMTEETNDIFYDDTRSGGETTLNIFNQKSETSYQSPRIISAHSINIKKERKVKKRSASLMKYLKDKSRPSHVRKNSHQIDLFFNGIAATVKNFSPEFQHMAKSRIFNIVSELEMAHLQL